ncbi:MAG: helix-turn-helix transcriptional regulator [Clostridia bacterium]|nr:helix-turn-helix transcriptional regulator [Clostridia bacterium]MBQ4587353.1 helix-turn-helix transcriptional regulator [Clostridia bacterium]
MTIGKRIREARKKLGISQETLARSVNSTKQAIYKYENDIVTNIPMEKVEIMADVLSVTPAYLMGWVDGNVYQCPDAEAIAEGKILDVLNDQEKTLLRLFREVSEEGKMRMIQSVLNVHDAEIKSSDSAGNSSLA